ncbi:hypothetical protein [Streptomyces sp. NPDC089919]|uniref:hypothetical protein n=1 Tax=Streptomyces sp. NPDC089919 TaxID=3155188 RepID=UPI0034223F0A
MSTHVPHPDQHPAAPHQAPYAADPYLDGPLPADPFLDGPLPAHPAPYAHGPAGSTPYAHDPAGPTPYPQDPYAPVDDASYPHPETAEAEDEGPALTALYAWAGTADGPDALAMVHFTTDDQEVALDPEGLARWPFHEAIREGGWHRFTDYDAWAVPAETWGAAYRCEDDMLVVSGPGSCAAWYQGSLGATEEWVAAARASESVVLLTAPIQHPDMYGYAVEADVAYALLVPLAVV